MRKKLVTAVAGFALLGTFTVNVGVLTKLTHRDQPKTQQAGGLLKLQLLKSFWPGP